MNRLLIFTTLLAASFARPNTLLEGNDGHVSVTHSTLGTYKFSVQLKDGLRSEERLADGTIIGEYPIPDESGVSKIIRYTSGKDGFQIIDGPGAEEAIVREAKSVVGEVPVVVPVVVPVAEAVEAKSFVEPQVIREGASGVVVIEQAALVLPKSEAVTFN